MRRKPLAERFWEKVDKQGDDDCWNWIASTNQTGYGQISDDFDVDVGLVMLQAHRVSWELHNGFIQSGMQVLHQCDNPRCVNPKHLFLGTQQQNMNDMKNKGRAHYQRDYQRAKETLKRALAARSHASFSKSGTRLQVFMKEHPEVISRGERHGKAKLTNDDVIQIRHMKENGASLSEIAEKFGIDQSAVSLIVNRKRWTHI